MFFLGCPTFAIIFCENGIRILYLYALENQSINIDRSLLLSDILQPGL